MFRTVKECFQKLMLRAVKCSFLCIFQLTIRVINDSCHTRNNLTFVRPTPANYERTSYTAAMYAKHYPVKTSFYLQGFGGVQIK